LRSDAAFAGRSLVGMESLHKQHVLGKLVRCTQIAKPMLMPSCCARSRWILLAFSSIASPIQTHVTYDQAPMTAMIVVLILNAMIGCFFVRTYWVGGHLHRLYRHVHWLRTLNGDTTMELQHDPFFVATEKKAMFTLVALGSLLQALPSYMLLADGSPSQGASWYISWATFVAAFQLAGRQAIWQHVCAIHMEQARLMVQLSRTAAHAVISSEFSSFPAACAGNDVLFREPGSGAHHRGDTRRFRWCHCWVRDGDDDDESQHATLLCSVSVLCLLTVTATDGSLCDALLAGSARSCR
jgi:hypothetical protein